MTPRLVLLVALTLILGSCGPTSHRAAAPPRHAPNPGVTEAAPGDLETAEVARTVYVPVYPYVYTEDRARPYNLAATLYVRNTDPSAALFVSSVRLHDDGGKLVRDDLTTPLRLAPLASAEFFVKESDITSGSSACFLVSWSGLSGINEPIIETVMIGTLSNQGISFTSRGRPILKPAQPH